MKNERLKRLLSEVPEDTKIFVRHYADLVARIHDILDAKGYTQKDLAELMDKMPSEISRWLSGKEEHNFTLRSISKLEAILQEPILEISNNRLTPVRKLVISHQNHVVKTSEDFFAAVQPSLGRAKEPAMALEFVQTNYSLKISQSSAHEPTCFAV